MGSSLKLTVAEYDVMVAKGAFDDLNQKIELICGEIQAMHPAGPAHDDQIGYLTRWSIENTDPAQIVVRIHSGLSIPELDSRPEPDVLWVKARRYLDRHPQAADVLLLIEVADSSLRTDREQKAGLYARAGIPEYWVVSAPERVLHVFRQPNPSGYESLTTAHFGDAVSPLIQPSAVVDLAILFASPCE